MANRPSYRIDGLTDVYQNIPEQQHVENNIEDLSSREVRSSIINLAKLKKEECSY